MDNLTFTKIKESLEKSQSIAVVTRKDPSVDEMAAALSLYLSLRLTGKNVTVATPNNPLVEVSSLVGIDEVRTNLGAADGDLVVSFPYREGEIEKVSYTRDDNFLNIVVKAGEKGLNFNEQDVRFTRGSQAPELLFVIGSPRVSDLGRLFDTQALKDTVVINIDNKPENQGYGDILMVSPRLSSVSEAVANLILSVGLKMDLDISQNLMMGLAVSTNNFQEDNTSPLAFEMAGILLRQGAIRPQSAASRRRMAAPQTPAFDEEMISTQPKPRAGRQEQPQLKQDLRRQQPQTRMQKPEDLAQDQPQEDFDNTQADESLQNPPEDWLEPKIYKGSTSF
jgi:hypothetical protein